MKKLIIILSIIAPLFLFGNTASAGGIDDYVKLMLHMDGAASSTVFTDSSITPKTVTAYGNAAMDTTQYVFGGASARFDGNVANYASSSDSADWDFGSGDFTIDMRVRFLTITQTSPLLGQYKASVNNWSLFPFMNNATAYDNTKFTIGFIGAAQRYVTWDWTASVDTWYHLEMVRSGSNWYLFINGTSTGVTQVQADYMPDVAAELRIGVDGSGWKAIDGWIDELRISKGIARHTANFTPPTEAYSLDAVVTALYNQIILWWTF